MTSHIGNFPDPNHRIYNLDEPPPSLMSSTAASTPAEVTLNGVGISVTEHDNPTLDKEGLGSDRSRDEEKITSESASDTASMQPMQEALEGTLDASDSAQSINALTVRGQLLSQRFQQFRLIEDINMAINCWAQVVMLTPDGHSFMPDALHYLGSSLVSRFEHLGMLSDVNAAVEYQFRAMSLTPDSDARKSGIFTDLGTAYLNRFMRLGELADASNAVSFHARAVERTPDDHTAKPLRLDNLGNSYARRFMRTGEILDINNALECHIQAVSLTAENSADRPHRTANLGNSYAFRFQHLGMISDINTSIEWQDLAASLTPDGHWRKLERLQNLGAAYQIRFERLGVLSDIKRALEIQLQMVSLTPDGHAEKPGRISNLGDSYLSRFQRLGDVSDINDAIDCQALAASLVPNGHVHKAIILKNLGLSYQSRFEHLGELPDIDNSIQCQIQVLLLTPDGHAYKPSRLDALGNAYMRRFQHLGELTDADKAIEHQTQAVLLAPEGHEQRQGVLANLSSSYMIRFQRTSEISDINKSIECRNQSLAITPADHTFKPVMISQLGSSYLARFIRFRDTSDVNDSIAYYTQGLLLLQDGHQQRPGIMRNLGVSYACRFDALSDLADLNKAVEYLVQAASRFPDGHPEKLEATSELGRAYLRRYERQKATQDLDGAMACFKQASQATIGPPRAKFQISHQWAMDSLRHGISAIPAYQRAIQLLPQLVWLGTTIDERYKLMTEIVTIATEAAACAIATEAYDHALEWLEAGRSIVWSQILQLRTSFDDISSKDPELSKRLKTIARQLEQAGSRSSQFSPLAGNELGLQTEAMRHHELASKWDKSLEQARSIPGFENFMRSRKANELKPSAKHGAVVVITIHQARCDALIIRPGIHDILPIHLDNFWFDKAVRLREHLAILTGRRHRAVLKDLLKANEKMKTEQSLRTLWYDLVKPVLDSLGYTKKLPADELPHLTWCTTGPLSFLPLHAAGPYDQSQPNAFDLVVSSYTPTLSALLAPTTEHSSVTSGLLTVGQEGSMGPSHLPFTKPELEAIKNCAKSTRYLQLDGNKATVDSVLDAMEQYSWVHLACHASQDGADPAQSAFHLHDGDLRLSAITKRSFKDKGLAFLSACQTATGDNKLPDEAVHLAAGMLMAGYPSVIATMWSIQDEDGPEVAGKVYAELLKDGSMNHTGAARALHKAIEGLRKKVGVEEFARWVPFIHMGQ